MPYYWLEVKFSRSKYYYGNGNILFVKTKTSQSQYMYVVKQLYLK